MRKCLMFERHKCQSQSDQEAFRLILISWINNSPHQTTPSDHISAYARQFAHDKHKREEITQMNFFPQNIKNEGQRESGGNQRRHVKEGSNRKDSESKQRGLTRAFTSAYSTI